MDLDDKLRYNQALMLILNFSKVNVDCYMMMGECVNWRICNARISLNGKECTRS